MPSLILLISLLALSSIFSASEVGFIYLNENSIASLKSSSARKNKKIFDTLLTNKGQILSTILLLNNIINASASLNIFIATSEIMSNLNLSEGYLITISAFISSTLIFIFGELIPKFFAIQNENLIIKFSGVFMYTLTKILFPFTLISSAVIHILSTIRKKEKNGLSFKDELRHVMDLRHKKGEVKNADKEMIDGILELNEAEVLDIVTPRSEVTFLDISDLQEMVSKISSSQYSRFPVIDSEKSQDILGIMHTKQFLSLYISKNGSISKSDIKSIISEPLIVPETKPLTKQLAHFKLTKKHIAIVVDEFGENTGIVTLEDIIEEIVGDIGDETDKNELEIIKQANGSIVMNGDYRVRDFNKEFFTSFDEEEFTTMAGLVLGKIDRIPAKNEIVEIEDYNFKTLSRSSSKIIKLELTQKK